MRFFNKLFGNGDDASYTNFEAGDVFYTTEGGKYTFFKVLKVDHPQETVHVTIYNDLDELPSIHEITKLDIQIYHTPIGKNGFGNARLFTKLSVEDDDLLGYHEYIKQTRNIDEIVAYAQKYYKEGYFLGDENKHEEAIRKYELAISLLPNFYEAIDNMAITKMDLGRWAEAIEDFKQSLQVKPDSLLAIVSIGKCYLRLNDPLQAREYFRQALRIDPNHEAAAQLLMMTEDFLKNNPL